MWNFNIIPIYSDCNRALILVTCPALTTQRNLEVEIYQFEESVYIQKELKLLKCLVGNSKVINFRHEIECRTLYYFNVSLSPVFKNQTLICDKFCEPYRSKTFLFGNTTCPDYDDKFDKLGVVPETSRCRLPHLDDSKPQSISTWKLIVIIIGFSISICIIALLILKRYLRKEEIFTSTRISGIEQV